MHLVSPINGLLKRCYKYGYCLKINTVEEVIESANYKCTKSTTLSPLYFASNQATKPWPQTQRAQLSDPQLLHRAA